MGPTTSQHQNGHLNSGPCTVRIWTKYVSILCIYTHTWLSSQDMSILIPSHHVPSTYKSTCHWLGHVWSYDPGSNYLDGTLANVATFRPWGLLSWNWPLKIQTDKKKTTTSLVYWFDSLPKMLWCLQSQDRNIWQFNVSQAAKVKNGRRCKTITSQKVKQERLYLGLSGVTGITCMLYHTSLQWPLKPSSFQTNTSNNDWSENPAAHVVSIKISRIKSPYASKLRHSRSQTWQIAVAFV